MIDKANLLQNKRSNHSRLTLVMFMRKLTCTCAGLLIKKQETTTIKRAERQTASGLKHALSISLLKVNLNQMLKLVLKQGKKTNRHVVAHCFPTGIPLLMK